MMLGVYHAGRTRATHGGHRGFLLLNGMLASQRHRGFPLLSSIVAFLSSTQCYLQHTFSCICNTCSTLSVVYVYVQHHNAILDHDELGHINCNLIVLYL